MMLRSTLILLLFVFSCADGYAQYTLRGVVRDSLSKGIPFAGVVLTRDSSVVKAVVANEQGSYFFENIGAGSYSLTVTAVGYRQGVSPVFAVTGDTHAPDLILFATTAQLQQVNVTAQRPFVEQHIDRTVINIAGSVTNSGTTVLSVLEKSPGITVNRQTGTINMSGKDGVQVMINGKLNYMPAATLVSMLDGMSSDNVDKLELITTPPSRLDAGGNAGYINIVLKQTPNEGFNGSYSLTAAGFKGANPAGNADFNYRKKRANLYGGYGASYWSQPQYTRSVRILSLQERTLEVNSPSERDPRVWNHNLRVGYDYAVTPRTTVGLLVSANVRDWSMKGSMDGFTAVDGRRDTLTRLTGKDINVWKNLLTNFNLQQKAGTAGELTLNIDYLRYYNENTVNYHSDFRSGTDEFLFDTTLISSKNTVIGVFPVQVDYRHKLSNRTSLETGVKTVFSRFENDVLVAGKEGSSWKPLPLYTGLYNLKENIGAAYLSTDVALNPRNFLKMGLRYEYTYSNLGSESTPDIVDRRYGKLFPTVYWSHTLKNKNKVIFSANRRINRPAFTDLAPFLIFEDLNSLVSGNEKVQPAISNTLKVNYVRKQYDFSLSYSHEKGAIAGWQTDIDTLTMRRYRRPQNMDYVQSWSAIANLPVKVTPRWTSYLSVMGLWQQGRASFTGKQLKAQAGVIQVSGAQMFSLGKTLSAEASGFYRSKGAVGLAIMSPKGALNLGVQKKWSSSSLRLGLDNVFSTQGRTRLTDDRPDDHYYSYMLMVTSQRIVKATFSHSFGNKILKGQRKRGTASDEERNRVNQ